jgi:hypothetical protein
MRRDVGCVHYQASQEQDNIELFDMSSQQHYRYILTETHHSQKVLSIRTYYNTPLLSGKQNA